MGFAKRFFLPREEKTTQISSFVLLEKKNSGGMADIYKARDKNTGRIYAVKVGVKKSEAISSIFNEFRIGNNITLFFNHPNIVRIYETGKDRNTDYVVMEFIEGDSLQRLLDNGRPLSYIEKLNISWQLAQGIEYLHKRGIVHNDNCPKNVMITPEKKVKIIDFGIATFIGSKMNKKAGIRAGTPGYMAPEQIRAMAVDFRTDIYGLGVTFYKLFTGIMPFMGSDNLGRMESHLNDEPQDIVDEFPDIDPRLSHLIMKSIRRKPEERFQKVSYISEILSELLNERGNYV